MDEQHRGPVMICATPIMRQGKTRIGRVGGVTLPRTVEVVTLAAAVVGALVGVAAAMAISSGMSAFIYGAIFGGAAGWFAVTYSPLQGESMLKWVELQLNTSRRARYIEGERVLLSVGLGVLPHASRGRVRLLRSAVRIPSTQFDERGVLLSPGNRNIPADGAIDPLLFAALSLPGEAGMSLTPVNDVALTGAGLPGSGRKKATAPQEPAVTISAPQRLKD